MTTRSVRTMIFVAMVLICLCQLDAEACPFRRRCCRNCCPQPCVYPNTFDVVWIDKRSGIENFDSEYRDYQKAINRRKELLDRGFSADIRSFFVKSSS
jgi:hypothetical protein